MLFRDIATGHCFIEVDGRKVYIQDPFDPESGILQSPRQADGGTWVPFGAADRSSQWVVFLYNSINGLISQWTVDNEGRYQSQAPISSTDQLRPLMADLHLLAEPGFLNLMLENPEAGRAASVRTLRTGIGNRQLAQRFLYAYYRAKHNPAKAQYYAGQYGEKQLAAIDTSGIKAMHPNSLKVLYLVQSARRLPNEMERSFASVNSDFHCLTFKEQVDDPHYTFKPGSTWTSGRNHLLSLHANEIDKYDYIILMDDDVRFDGMTMADALPHLHSFLSEYQPEICVTAWPSHPGYGRLYDRNETYRLVDGFDALLNAFRRDVVKDGILFPYFECLDHSSWWSSQLVLMQIANRFYRPIQYNRLCASSAYSSPYPRGNIGEHSVSCLLTLCCSGSSPNFALHPHAVEIRDGFNELQSSLQQRIVRYYSFNPGLRDSLYRNPIAAF